MPTHLTRGWRSSLWRWLAVGVVALGVGLWLHAVPLTLLAATVACLAYGTYRLSLLTRLLGSRRRMSGAEGSGLFDEIQNVLRRRQRDSFDAKRRFVRLLRSFRDAAAALPDAVVALDGEQRIEWFNTAASTLLGLKYPQDVDGHLTNLVRSPRFSEWLHSGGGEPLTDLAAPGDENLRLNLRLIRYASTQALLVARDVSQLVRLEQVRRDFVANVSHELRTPLTVVHGYLDMIEPEQVPEYEPILHELRTQSRRMTQIVEDLLTLSRLEAQTELPQDRINLRALLEALRREGAALSQGQHTVTTELRGRHDLLGSSKELQESLSLLRNLIFPPQSLHK